MHERLITTLILAVTITILTPSSSTAAVRHIDARCGAHRGRLVIPYLHRYHVRIGPKHPGGRQRCHGRVHRHKTNTAGALIGSWFPFSLDSWTWRGVLDVGATTVFTSASCSTFAAAMIGEIPTAGIDSPARGSPARRAWQAGSGSKTSSAPTSTRGVDMIRSMLGFIASHPVAIALVAAVAAVVIVALNPRRRVGVDHRRHRRCVARPRRHAATPKAIEAACARRLLRSGGAGRSCFLGVSYPAVMADSRAPSRCSLCGRLHRPLPGRCSAGLETAAWSESGLWLCRETPTSGGAANTGRSTRLMERREARARWVAPRPHALEDCASSVSHRWLSSDDPASAWRRADISPGTDDARLGRGVRCGRWVYGGIAAISQEASGF